MCGLKAHIGPRLPIIEVFTLNTHTYHVGHLRKRDQPVEEATTYTIHNKHKRRIAVSSAGFEHDDYNKRMVSGLNFRPHGHRDRHLIYIFIYLNYIAV
jgi:hypothetical protein